MRVAGKFAVMIVVLAGALALVGPASATTFCVPNTTIAGCPAGSFTPLGSSDVAKIQSAMGGDDSDGIPDTLYIAPGTFATDSVKGPYKTTGSDDLTVIGAGRDKTFLTSSETTNQYVVNLTSGNSRHVTLKDLSIVVPESFPNNGNGGTAAGFGSALQMQDDELDSVDIINRNVPLGSVESGSSGIGSIQYGGVLNNVRFRGENGARFNLAINIDSNLGCGTGPLEISQLEISNALSGVSTACPGTPVQIDRASFNGIDYALQASTGASISGTNVLITSGAYSPILAYNSGAKGSTRIDLNQATVVATGDPSKPAVRATVANQVQATDSISVSFRNSIITGFEKTWQIESPDSNTIGDATLNFDYSSFDPVGTGTGDVAVNQGVGNISGAPGFAGLTDFHLASGSPAIDAGDPNATLPASDLDGAARPVDGNNDGTAIRDMGAFEAPPVICTGYCPGRPTCEEDPAVCPPGADTKAPLLGKFRFRYRAGKGGVLRFRVSEAVTARVVLRPVPKGKRRVVRLSRKTQRAMALVFKLGKKKLKPGRYAVRIVAVDGAGNRSKPLARKVRVKGRNR